MGNKISKNGLKVCGFCIDVFFMSHPTFSNCNLLQDAEFKTESKE